MSRKENFVRELRRFRRRWFPTASEKEARKNFMANLMKASNDINYYVNAMLKKG